MTYFVFLLPIVTIVAVFTFIAIANWSDNRRKEREAFYRSETYRKVLEQPGGSAERVLEMMQEEERQRARRRVDGLRLGGLVTVAAGLGVMVFLKQLEPDKMIFTVGIVPIFIGLVLAVYGFSAKK